MPDRTHPTRLDDFLPIDRTDQESEAPAQGPVDQGPCLYFGPSGERCDRRAMEGGFCTRHQPVAPGVLSSAQVARRGIAILGVLAALWPVLGDLIREIIRLLR